MEVSDVSATQRLALVLWFTVTLGQSALVAALWDRDRGDLLRWQDVSYGLL